MADASSNEAIIGWSRDLGLNGLAARMEAAAQGDALTPLSMFMDADWVVKSVMLGLFAASILAWAIWFAKLGQLALANRNLARCYGALDTGGTLDSANATRGAIGRMIAAAQGERSLARDLPAEGIKERCALELTRIEAGAGRAMQSGATVIGTIGATAPFIGLFGTVWGIMNAFVGIAQSGTTDLSVVAPGIAEALLATAIGLVAAIPAVILYNHLTRVIAAYRARLGDAAALVLRCPSRDLDRERHAQRPQHLPLAAE